MIILTHAEIGSSWKTMKPHLRLIYNGVCILFGVTILQAQYYYQSAFVTTLICVWNIFPAIKGPLSG